MKTIQLIGHVDESHRLSAEVPPDVPTGPVHITVAVQEGTEAAAAQEEATHWMAVISKEWAEDLADPRQDIYTLADGEPLDASR